MGVVIHKRSAQSPSIPDHYDGMRLQSGLVNTIFYYGATGQLPASLDQVDQFVAGHYGDYLYFTNNLFGAACGGDDGSTTGTTTTTTPETTTTPPGTTP